MANVFMMMIVSFLRDALMGNVTVWIHQKGQFEIMTFLACLFDANQILLLPFWFQASHFCIISTFLVPYHYFFTV